jgi:hypothetical protein
MKVIMDIQSQDIANTKQESHILHCDIWYKDLLSAGPSVILEDHPLLAVHDCLFAWFMA